MIDLAIGFLSGVIITVFVVSYTISIVYEKQIKKDILVQELLEENSNYKKHYEATADMNKDYWG